MSREKKEARRLIRFGKIGPWSWTWTFCAYFHHLVPSTQPSPCLPCKYSHIPSSTPPHLTPTPSPTVYVDATVTYLHTHPVVVVGADRPPLRVGGCHGVADDVVSIDLPPPPPPLLPLDHVTRRSDVTATSRPRGMTSSMVFVGWAYTVGWAW